jgi:tetratricopeptide (TPR) repeat protein
MECAYPYYPAADWRFAVSRRFNHPYVDSIYHDLILPSLNAEGLVLECSYASDRTADEDFWMNRIDLILAIADFHILIDIDRNHNIDFEFERAERISRYRESTAFSRNLNWTPIIRKFLLRPITILIKGGVGRDRRSARKRRTILFLPDTASREDFIKRLRAEIGWAKSRRLNGLERVRTLFEKKIRFFGMNSDEMEFTLVKMTEIARSVKSGQLSETLSSIAEEIQEKERTRQQIVNENFELRVRMKKGEVEIPSGFRETYLLLFDQSHKNLASIFSQELADGKFLRRFAQIGALIGTLKVRRKRTRAKLRLAAKNQNAGGTVSENSRQEENRGVEDAVACYILGSQFDSEGNYEEAIRNYSRAIEMNSQYLDPYKDRAYLYHSNREYDAAVHDYSKAIELDAQNSDLYCNRGIAFHNQKELDLAISDYDKAIGLNPKITQAYFGRGNAYFSRHDFDQAIVDYGRVIELNPEHAEAYERRGCAYIHDGNYQYAIKDLSKAIELDPQLTNAYFSRSRAYTDLDNYAEAINDYTKVIELNPESVTAYFSRGLAYHRRGDYQGAIRDYSTAIGLDPQHPRAHYYRGLAREIQGEPIGARADRQKYRRLQQE